MDSFEDLDFFVSLVHQGSLAALARTRNVTPAAISIRLGKLEKRLGIRLLNRSTRRFSLTDEGEMYFTRGVELLEGIKSLNQSVSSGRTQAKGLLRVHAPLAFGRRQLAPLISAFCQRYPEVDVRLELSHCPIDLVERGFDVCLRFGLPPDSRLIARKIISCRRLLCASPAYLHQAGIPHHPRELLEHCCIVQHGGENTNPWLFTRGNEQQRVKVSGQLSCNEGEVMLEWALSGHGILIRRDWYIGRFIRSGQLQQVLADWSLEDEHLYAVYLERKNLPARVTLFIDYISRQLRATLATEPDRPLVP
jgi:LysR family transcriptional activator of dmlA